MWEGCSHFYFIKAMKKLRILDIYIDESGDFSLYSSENPIYSVAFILVDRNTDNNSPINKFRSNLNKLVGGDHFVHVGNLVRGEKPYKEMDREERWKLFYVLYLFAYHSKYNVAISSVIKEDSIEATTSSLAISLLKCISELQNALSNCDQIILHYDYGQSILAGLITATFLSKYPSCIITKTSQCETPFMQVADLFAYFDLLNFKISKGFLSKSETRFFGGIRNLKKKYLRELTQKYLFRDR